MGDGKEKNIKNKSKANKYVYKCEVCDYTCQKVTTLKKHKNTKHIGNVCKGAKYLLGGSFTDRA